MNNTQLDVLIIEDSISYAIELEMICSEVGLNVIATASESSTALDIIFADDPDLILMDINIGGKLTGLEIGQKIKHLDIPILYITSFGDNKSITTAQSSNMAGYLIKPISEQKVKATLEKIMLNQHAIKDEGDSAIINKPNKKQAVFFIKDGMYHKIQIEDVLYVESEDNYCHFRLVNETKFLIRITMKEVEGLTSEKFFRCHRRFIVNTRFISSINIKENFINLEGDHTIPFSRSKKKEIIALGAFLN